MGSRVSFSSYWSQLGRWQRRGILMLVAVSLYTLVGFLLLPEPIRSLIERETGKLTGRVVTLERLEINPYDFSVTLRGLQLTGEQQEAMLAFRQLHINLSVRHLLIGQLVLEELSLDQPGVDVRVNPEGGINWQQLISEMRPPTEEGVAQEEAAPPLPLRIEHLRVDDGRVLFEDRSLSEPYQAELAPLNLELFNFSTRPQDGEAPYSFNASLDQETSLSWQGDLSVVPFRSSGEFTLQGVRVRRIWEYLQEQLAFEVYEGKVTLGARYRVDGSEEAMVFSLHEGLFELDDLRLGYKRAADNLIAIPRLAASGIELDSASQSIRVDQLVGQDAQISSQFKRSGQLNLQELFAEAKAIDGKAADSTGDEAPLSPGRSGQVSAADQEAAELPWSFHLNRFAFSNYRIDFSDRSVESPPSWTLSPVNLEGGPVEFPQENPVEFALDLAVDDGAQAQVSGALWFSPRVEVETRLKGFDLARLQPYIDPLLQLQLEQGRAGIDGKLLWQGGEESQLRFEGDFSIEEFVSRDTIDYLEFVKWQSLLVEGIDFDQQANALSIARVATRKPYARVIIYPDLSVNLSQILSPPESSASAPAEHKAAPAGDSQTATEPMQISIARVELSEGEANFADLSLQPQFATGIYQLQGSVEGLDSDSSARAAVDISGKVDRYAPVTIKGQINPLSAEAFTDLGLSFSNVELTTLTPYSGKFAGYTINKGKLSLNLHYLLENRQLKGENRMVLDQLTLGSRTDSPDATSLPVTLAIALMKDSKGRIDIDLPVSGDLDNPDFSYGGLIAKALVNLITNIISSPFRALGSLLGDDAESYGQIGFAPGSSELSEAVRTRLQTLVTALEERPTIKLELTGGSSEGFDWPPFARQQWQQQLQLEGWKRLKAEGKAVPSAPEDLLLPAELRSELVFQHYSQQFQGELPADGSRPPVGEMEARLIDAIKPQSSVLRQLAQERAANVRNYLLAELGFMPERLYLMEVNMEAAVEAGEVQVELTLTD
ncbi:DUF748 domain-containing protein [Aestuariirhabdus litorea]|uniref:DUF748 domain-containing protein n=1 Tax=Aestuariirhabdus litorea TaxID=2528527 RepID=A0A3P3VNH9_9GAMM|nr:DUF748 domain-containing protein [Aestuariirhabdus litorea]RRJ84312.1 DUF748 domain-containing protein [Aestuariirhabdus litorea]RWW97535.1 DUF748 domain-containing protein [Endozoicomonadaceae bacterium GTF-13]